jgi:preprotein translocase subunit SecE
MATTKKKFFSRIADWFRGMKSELKKVVWPSAKQITNNSLVVILVMIVAAIVVGGFDFLASSLVELLTNIFGG